jgi:xanthine/CO dehydrogenase XdhC/CoxF family maturation factor
VKSLLEIIDRVSARRSESWALATVVRTRGSTYRKPGARLLVDRDGRSTGVLSGGCLEDEIARIGLEVLHSGRPRLTTFDTRKLYGCGGQLDVFLERLPPAGNAGNLITLAGDRLGRREPCCIRTVFENEMSGSELLPPGIPVPECDGVLLHCLPLPVRLLIFGNGPEVAPLRAIAGVAGWIVKHFRHPDEFTSEFQADSQTGAVVMMHHFGRDLAALHALLPLGLRYIGLLGPQRRSAELLARLQEFQPASPAELDFLHAPAGLDTGSEAPEEIALSIVAEAAAVLSGRRGGFLRERRESPRRYTLSPLEKIA